MKIKLSNRKRDASYNNYWETPRGKSITFYADKLNSECDSHSQEQDDFDFYKRLLSDDARIIHRKYGGSIKIITSELQKRARGLRERIKTKGDSNG